VGSLGGQLWDDRIILHVCVAAQLCVTFGVGLAVAGH
jgi:hypothetical protein